MKVILVVGVRPMPISRTALTDADLSQTLSVALNSNLPRSPVGVMTPADSLPPSQIAKFSSLPTCCWRVPSSCT